MVAGYVCITVASQLTNFQRIAFHLFWFLGYGIKMWTLANANNYVEILYVVNEFVMDPGL